MDNNQKVASHILSLKRTLKYEEKKLLQEGKVEPVIYSIRKRTSRFYLFIVSVFLLVLVLGIVRVIFANVSFFEVLFPIGATGFIAVFSHKNFKHIEKILNESESML